MIKITSNFTAIKLDDPNPGRCAFWDKVMAAMESLDFAVLKIGVKMPTGAGGFFTELLAVDSINLPDGPVLENNKIKFPDDNAFGVFIHEAAHFLHLIIDEGRRITKGHEGEVLTFEDQINDRTNTVRREIEYEAGYRSVYYNAVYKMFPGREIINLNLANMVNYDLSKQPADVRKKINDMCGEGEKIVDKLKPVFAKVNKFSEWIDPKHIIKI